MGHSIGAAHDPSAPAGHLPGFAREEQRIRSGMFLPALRAGRNSTRRCVHSPTGFGGEEAATECSVHRGGAGV